MSRTISLRVTLQGQVKKGHGEIFCKKPEMAGPAESSRQKKNERNSLTVIPHSFDPDAPCTAPAGQEFPDGGSEQFFLAEQKRKPVFTGTGARDRNGDVHLSQPRLLRSSRYRRISSGTCIPPGGWLFPPGAGAVRHRHRCGLSRRQLQVCRWMIAVRLWAFVHQSYGYCTIITQMRINHLKDRTLTQPGRHHRSPGFLKRAPSPSTPDSLRVRPVAAGISRATPPHSPASSRDNTDNLLRVDYRVHTRERTGPPDGMNAPDGYLHIFSITPG